MSSKKNIDLINDPVVSIIVPVYNSELHLSRCLDSLISQDYSNIEIILINDGSIDNSLAILKEYEDKDERIKVFDQTNSGVSHARNVGLSEAKGEYICFVDSDDYVDTTYVSNFIKGLDKNSDLVFQGLNEIHLDKSVRRVIPKQAFYSYSNILNGISDINKHKIFGYVCNKLYKASIIRTNNLKFREDINISEDRIFALKYLQYVQSMQVVAESAYNYELQETGLTLKHRPFDEIKKAADINLQEAISLLKQRDSSRFEQDTRKMYIMSAIGFMGVLFQEKSSWIKRYKAVNSFRESYSEWLSNYTPITRHQKIIIKSLGTPSIISVIIQSLYWQLKKFYEKITQIGKH